MLRTSKESIRKFSLSDTFIDEYKDREVPWGPVGYVTYKSRYARRREELNPHLSGTEEWYETCRRVVEGVFTIQKKHIVSQGTHWDNAKAQRTAKDMYERLFSLKWTPPGRGLWMMGTPYVENRTGAGLFNCSFRSTRDIAEKGGYLFGWIMDALMLGVGVGFDTKGAGSVQIKNTRISETEVYVIPDSREGWVQSYVYVVDGFLTGKDIPRFDYSEIRGPNLPIKGFGGTSSGPQPLMDLHFETCVLLSQRIGDFIQSTDIVRMGNLVGKCVVAGNVRRSAELALGEADDEAFLSMKDPVKNAGMNSYCQWASNNSPNVKIGMDYTRLAEQSAVNGEPGYIWLDNARRFGRIKDGPTDDDYMVMGFNPCVEQQLEDAECCCLVETFMSRHDSLEDYLKTLKVAYLYGKTVTLINTHWPETNAVMLKNRRIGTSISGIWQAFEKFGRRNFFSMCDTAYGALKEWDKIYSDWFCVPRSKRMTSIKPSGSVSLLPGVTPGAHSAEDEYYIRRIRFQENDPVFLALKENGYYYEKDAYSPNTVVVDFPVKEAFFSRGKRDISMWEQLEVAAQLQSEWADNSVSITVTFQPSEAKDIKYALELYETRLKAVSFLPYFDPKNSTYVQMPYEPISKLEYEKKSEGITPVTKVHTETGGVGEKFCTNDVCEMDWNTNE